MVELKELIEYFRGEGRVIKGAPVAFGLSVIFASAAVFGFLDWHFNGVIDDLQAANTLLQEETKGIPPQQAAQLVQNGNTLKKLQEFYVAGGPIIQALFVNDEIPINVTADLARRTSEFDKKKKVVQQWTDSTAKWIERNMGEAASDRFLDTSEWEVGMWDGYTDDQNDFIKDANKRRKNLREMIESGAWYNAP